MITELNSSRGSVLFSTWPILFLWLADQRNEGDFFLSYEQSFAHSQVSSDWLIILLLSLSENNANNNRVWNKPRKLRSQLAESRIYVVFCFGFSSVDRKFNTFENCLRVHICNEKKAVWIFAQNYFKIFRCRLSNFDAWYISRIHTEHFGVSFCKNSQKWVHLEFPVIDIFQYQNRFLFVFY